ncbi:NB-ARC domain-containing protein [Oscillatoria sp. CS-180]|uniref:NB-ARC domain-containing protein n=1 Tax=Oscillatoria sp. CS-180 TaxID=3021720 RepID=UPI00232D6810|nr:NB-ARC domain-containing protein [Oscillatoria sp. CS-180]MDB9529850.1 NB-ARC domain-containing protein [Oscillatoria sp. CS-180]
MTFEEALKMLETLWKSAHGRSLTSLERSILEVAWHQESYVSLSERLYLTEGHIKDTAADLWKGLSVVLDLKITKRTLRSSIEQALNHSALSSLSRELAVPSDSPSLTFGAMSIDWADAPDVSLFLGRQAELQILEHWIVQDRCRVVALTGIGGIGKTALAAQLGHRIQEQFEFVIWRSLLNAPPLSDVLQALIGLISGQDEIAIPVSFDDQLLMLLKYLRQHRCLMILDNVETVLAAGPTGTYRSGYEDYDQLFRRLGETTHKSCLMLTSREKPPAIARLEGPHKTVRSLEVTGLKVASGQQIVQAFGLFTAEETDWTALVQLYQGHPLALELAAKHIEAVFFGDVAAFLNTGKPIFGDIQTLLDWHMQRLSDAETELLYWLAIHREALSLAEMRRDILSRQRQAVLPMTLQSLNQHLSLIKSHQRFALQPVILEHVTECWVQQAIAALLNGDLIALDDYALLTTTAKDYVQAAQRQLMLQAVCDQLLEILGSAAHIKARIYQLFADLREHPTLTGYGAGNLLNVLCQLNTTVDPCDCSQLTLRHVYLQGMTLTQVDFSASHFHDAIFTQAFGDTTATAFSANGDWLATAHSNNEIHLFQVEDGQLRRIFLNAGALWVWSLRFVDSDRLIISTGANKTIRFWNVETGQCEKVLQDDGFLACTATVDGPERHQLISSHDDGYIRFWDLTTQTCQRKLESHRGWTWSLTISPDGQSLLAGGAKTLLLLDIETGECLRTFEGHQAAVKTALFGRDNVIISGSDDGCVKVWSLHTGACLWTLGPYAEPAQAIAVDATSDRLFIGVAGALRCWDLGTQTCLWTLQAAVPPFESLSFHPATHRLVSGHNHQLLKLWDVSSQHCLRTWQGYHHVTLGIAFDTSGDFLLTGHNGVVRLWDVKSAACLQTCHGHQHLVWNVAFHPNGEQLISCSSDGTLKFWDRATGACLKTFATSEYLWCMAVSPDGQWLAAGSQTGRIFLLNLLEGTTLKCFAEQPSWILSLAFSPDNQTLVSGHEAGAFQLWDIQSRICCQTFQSTVQAFDVAFSPDGVILAGTVEDTVHFWDVDTGELRSVLRDDGRRFHCIRFTPDGKRFITGDYSRSVKLWDLQTMECLHTHNDYSTVVGAIALNPNWDGFVTNTDRQTVQMRSVKTGKVTKAFKIPGPYEGTQIAGIQGVTSAQIAALQSLGAIA